MKRSNSRREVPASSETYASTIQVSRALGVSVSTVKRWVDDGILKAQVSPGGHRKLLLREVLQLAQSGKLPYAEVAKIVPLANNSRSELPQLRTHLDAAIRRSDADSIQTLIFEAYRSGHPIEVLADSLIAITLRDLGHAWVNGTVSIMHEHLITQAFVAALYQLHGNLPVLQDPARPLAIGAAPEADHYILPSLLAKTTLQDAGWNAINIGPNTPFSALLSALEELRPRLVWLSVSHLAEPNRFVEEYRRFYRSAEERGVAVALGGQALTHELRSQLPYTTFGDGFVQLSAFAKMLHPRPPLPKRGRPAGSKKSAS